VLRALAACPHHGEAGRWSRVLRDLAEGQRVSVLDRHSLMPVAGNGWVAPERYRRRVLSELGYTASPPPGSSLSQLQDAGVLEHYFALPEEHATLPADHPLTLLELHADRVRALTHEAREASGEGWRLWERARTTDETAAEDAALLLTALATTAPGLADLGWSVADWAVRQRCRDGATWRAYRARHAARARRRNAREDALAVLEDAGAPPTAFQLAVEALAAVGQLPAAQAAARRHAHRSELTRELEALERGAPLPARCMVTPRLLPRGEAAAH
jgi:hypothetical protein